MLKKEEPGQIIKQGYELLATRFGYTQVVVLRKLKTLGTEVSPATFSNILKGKHVGKDTLLKLSQGIQQIIASELGMVYTHEKKSFSGGPSDPGWKSILIADEEPEVMKQADTIIFHKNGRLNIPDKVKFMNQAKKEIVEVGVRLNTFSDYFNGRNESEFRGPIIELLRKGVDLKLFVLDPSSHEALMYFNDRSKAQPEEDKSIEVAQKAIEKIKKIKDEFLKFELKGEIKVYTYKHIPYNHFLIIDGDTKMGQMMISHYIYGVNRADCPVFEISKVKDSRLFNRYWTSFESLTINARQIV